MRRTCALPTSVLAFAAAALLSTTVAAQSPVTERLVQCSLV